MHDQAWLEQSPNDRILATTGWREYAMRLAVAGYQRADANQTFVKQAFHRLVSRVPRDDGPDAVTALRRAVRVMNAFAGLTAEDREVLLGRLPIADTWGRTGNEIVEMRVRRQSEVWAKDDDLAALRAEMDAEAAAVEAQQGHERHAHQAALHAALEVRKKADGMVLQLHKKGVRLDVTGSGRAVAFPASSLTATEAAFLVMHNTATADAIKAAWTV